MAGNKGRILIVDDQVQILNSLKILLEDEFSRVGTLRDPNRIPEMFWRETWDVILLDMNFARGSTSGNEGLFWLGKIRESDPEAVIILITAYGDIELAVKAIKLGATDFITKPWDSEKLIITLRNALELRRTKRENDSLKNSQRQMTDDFDRTHRLIPGSSKVMKELMATVEKVAGTGANVLILGENGTGKELIARELHRKSPRAENIFSAVDVAALSETLFESEMFGHVRGAFTDAREDKTGRIENATGGTLFLDEIGNLSLSLQAKLLQVIEERKVTRVGSTRPVEVDVRLVTATNRSLRDMVAGQTFREDLYYRLNTIELVVPPLREREGDVGELAEYFLKEYARKYGKPFLRLTRQSMDKLAAWSWPGNVRELRHTMEKSVILCDREAIGPGDIVLNNETREQQADDDTLRLSDVERKTILKVLGDCRGNYTKAARILDISRTTLYAKIRKYDL